MQRQIKSCTHCRQHKVKCDAAKCYPNACTRCEKFHLNCIVDQHFKPRKGGQVELLRESLTRIQEQIQNITGSNGNAGHANGEFDTKSCHTITSIDEIDPINTKPAQGAHLNGSIQSIDVEENNDKITEERPTNYQSILASSSQKEFLNVYDYSGRHESNPNGDDDGVKEIEASVAERMAAGGHLIPISGPYTLEQIQLEESYADTLHDYFMEHCAPYMPMFESSTAGELYARSEFLFWAVMVTAALFNPTSHLYVSMVDPVKRLAATKTLLATTRSSSVVQALLVLSTWPLPAMKMLEDMTPRYASLAHSMGLQLGMHRGKFIYEFSRNQLLMPNAVKWRTRTWVQTYITQQMVSAATGIPACVPVDHMIEYSMEDNKDPLASRTLAFLKFATFYAKTTAIMASSVNTQDGLMEPKARCPTLELLRTDLQSSFTLLIKDDDPVIEIIYSYAHCILDAFAFTPDTPQSHQSGFITNAFQSCTRIVTLTRKLVGNRKIIEFPSFIRNPCTFAAIILFRLHLMPQLPEHYVVSARESIVTIHHLFRNMPQSWLTDKVHNDIARTAKILESLNHVIITHPELLQSRRVMRRMRSHLTFSLFYELVYIIHEARRRNAQKGGSGYDSNSSQNSLKLNGNDISQLKRTSVELDQDSPDSWTSDNFSPGPIHRGIHAGSNKRKRDLNPLPLFSDINMNSYFASTAVSPNGTTSTKLVPTVSNLREVAPSNQIIGDHYSAANSNTDAPPDSVTSSSRGSNGSATGPQENSATNGSVHEHQYEDPTLEAPAIPDDEIGITQNLHLDGTEAVSDVNHILDGIDWMNTEGDDFLGWMLPRNE